MNQETTTTEFVAAAEEVSLVRSLDNFGFIGLVAVRGCLSLLLRKVLTVGVLQKRISVKRGDIKSK